MLEAWLRKTLYDKYGSQVLFEDKWFHLMRIGLAFVVIFSVLLTAMVFNKPEYREILIEDHVDPVLNADDFHHIEISSIDASLYSFTLNTKRIGLCTKIEVNGEDSRALIKLNVYEINEGESIEEAFQDRVENEVTNVRSKRNAGSSRRSYMPTVKYERAIEQMIQLDLGYTQAYAMTELNTTASNVFFIQNMNKIILIETYVQIQEEELLHLLEKLIQSS